MRKEECQSLKVGDRVRLTPHLPAYLVVDTRYAKQGAIGIFGDLPEHEQAAKKATEAFAAAVRDDKVRPIFS